jgi:ribosome maturation factor RimP
MDIVSQIREWSEAFLKEEEGLFLVDIEQKVGSKKISVYIDGDQGVNIEACRRLSRTLSENLDSLDYGDSPYYLEVSSPGVDRPLQFSRQYNKHIGRELKVNLTAKTELEGKLEDVNEKEITILLKDKKKGYKDATAKTIAFNDIADSIVIISFK